ncbi:uncharacterized protein LOC129599616 [Paramacrobiotus metropolitanus]|uniref:uncharacterized protein LOC129599616 n=1 Tax=Paramacrobiotus metropolitanus TaxID=2943436 RepID=UPI00244594DE|nr:uncharacterized protein LOC129599616 [Paramacrobiotus metropolitanus]
MGKIVELSMSLWKARAEARDASKKLEETTKRLKFSETVRNNLDLHISLLKEKKELQKQSIEKTDQELWKLRDVIKKLESEKKNVESERDATRLECTVQESQFKESLELAKREKQELENDLQTCRELEFRVEKFKDNDAAIKHLTGIPTYALLHTLVFDFLDGKNSDFVDRIPIRRSKNQNPDRSRKRGKTMSLSYFDQYFVTLFK